MLLLMTFGATASPACYDNYLLYALLRRDGYFLVIFEISLRFEETTNHESMLATTNTRGFCICFFLEYKFSISLLPFNYFFFFATCMGGNMIVLLFRSDKV